MSIRANFDDLRNRISLSFSQGCNQEEFDKLILQYENEAPTWRFTELNISLKNLNRETSFPKIKTSLDLILSFTNCNLEKSIIHINSEKCATIMVHSKSKLHVSITSCSKFKYILNYQTQNLSELKLSGSCESSTIECSNSHSPQISLYLLNYSGHIGFSSNRIALVSLSVINSNISSIASLPYEHITNTNIENSTFENDFFSTCNTNHTYSIKSSVFLGEVELTLQLEKDSTLSITNTTFKKKTQIKTSGNKSSTTIEESNFEESLEITGNSNSALTAKNIRGKKCKLNSFIKASLFGSLQFEAIETQCQSLEIVAAIIPTDCLLRIKGPIHISNSQIGSAYISGSYVVAMSTLFLGQLRIGALVSKARKISFYNCNFSYAPYLDLDQVPEDTIFLGCKFNEYSHESLAKYRKLKNLLAASNNHSEEILFTSLELKSRFKVARFFNKHEYQEKVLGFFAFIFNDFGNSLLRPLYWCAAISLLLGTAIYFGGFIVDNEKYTKSLSGETWISKYYDLPYYLKSYIFSLIHSLGPLRLITGFELSIPTNMTIKALSGFSSILTSILLYLFASGVKKRFRQN